MSSKLLASNDYLSYLNIEDALGLLQGFSLYEYKLVWQDQGLAIYQRSNPTACKMCKAALNKYIVSG